MQIRKAFGITVRRLRLRARLTQEELALQAGVDRGYMGGLERGEHSPTLETVYKLLPCLKISFWDFAREFDKTVRQKR